MKCMWWGASTHHCSGLFAYILVTSNLNVGWNGTSHLKPGNALKLMPENDLLDTQSIQVNVQAMSSVMLSFNQTKWSLIAYAFCNCTEYKCPCKPSVLVCLKHL